jgi:5'-3' exonuclease|tara:strand:+ start:315 stop:1160 length:846 start_codon:yes stop_codon:yes gene_type:complete
MILVDMNQISLASMMMHLHMSKSKEIDENMVRHMILNSLRMYRTKYSSEFGELVLCYDSKHYWRRDYFPEYKFSRRKGREKSDLDWNAIFSCLNQIKDELRNNMPYKFVEIYGAEADDVIGVLCSEYSEEIMIISGDKDFIQLQKFPNVKQFSPITKKTVNGENPGAYLKEHIFKGDTSDGVPNVLSPDNTFTDGLRQKPLAKKKIASWMEHNFEDVAPNDEVKRNYQRNRKLIDLTYTPEELSSEIINTYKEAPYGDRSKLLNYFIQKRLRNLTESIGEF